VKRSLNQHLSSKRRPRMYERQYLSLLSPFLDPYHRGPL
jgi:hypothetical protein